MKNIAFFIALFFCFQAFGQRKPKIKGNKNVIEVREELPTFSAIELKDDLDIMLQRASSEGYSITADDNLIDVLKFEVEDSTLVISSYYKITGKKKLDITINYNYIEAITMQDGRIEMKDIISSDQFFVNTYGSSKLQLNANASIIHINMEGNSSGDMNLQADTLSIKLKDRIDVGIYATVEKNTVEMHKNASMNMEGTGYMLSARLYENANLKARKFEAEGVEVIAEGSPSARVFARKDFELTSRGSSKTYLSGEPTIEILEFLDTSELHKEK